MRFVEDFKPHSYVVYIVVAAVVVPMKEANLFLLQDTINHEEQVNKNRKNHYRKEMKIIALGREN